MYKTTIKLGRPCLFKSFWHPPKKATINNILQHRWWRSSLNSIFSSHFSHCSITTSNTYVASLYGFSTQHLIHPILHPLLVHVFLSQFIPFCMASKALEGWQPWGFYLGTRYHLWLCSSLDREYHIEEPASAAGVFKLFFTVVFPSFKKLVGKTKVVKRCKSKAFFVW